MTDDRTVTVADFGDQGMRHPYIAFWSPRTCAWGQSRAEGPLRAARRTSAYLAPMHRQREVGFRIGLVALALGVVGLVTPPLDGWLNGGRPGRLSWEEARRLLPAGRPYDRLLAASLRNHSTRAVELRADEIRLLDGDGGDVPARVALLGPPASGGSPGRAARGEPRRPRRLVSSARVEPGDSIGMRLAWRRPERLVDAPVWLQYGAGSLVLP